MDLEKAERPQPRPAIASPENRTRLYTAMLALGLFASLPVPGPREPTAWNVIVLTLWVGIGSLAWAAWFRRDLVDLIWVTTFIVGVVGAVSVGLWMPAILLSVWRLYLARRRAFDARTLVFAALLLSFSGVAVAKANPESVIPKHLIGFRVDELTSCGPILLVPWKFRPDRRSTRLLIKDKMRLNSETKMSHWEVHQVMDSAGYVTFIFRRQLKDGRYESIVTKDAVYNRILETRKGKPRVVEVFDLRAHINRPVLTFQTERGAILTFEPGSAGTSQITIQHGPPPEGGRYLPPVYIRGNYCTRPESDSDDKADPMKATPTKTAPPAGGAPK